MNAFYRCKENVTVVNSHNPRRPHEDSVQALGPPELQHQCQTSRLFTMVQREECGGSRTTGRRYLSVQWDGGKSGSMMEPRDDDGLREKVCEEKGRRTRRRGLISFQLEPLQDESGESRRRA